MNTLLDKLRGKIFTWSVNSKRYYDSFFALLVSTTIQMNCAVRSWWCKTELSKLIMNSCDTSINILQNWCKCFFICMRCNFLQLQLLDVEMRFTYFLRNNFDTKNTQNNIVCDAVKHYAKSNQILSKKNTDFFLSILPILLSVDLMISTWICHQCTMFVKSSTCDDVKVFLK